MNEARSGDVVVGLGNPIMGDDGVGLAALERLREGWEIPAAVELVDGGTWGMTLLPLIESSERVLFLDAIRTGGPIGAAVTLRGAEIPRQVALKVSQHQIDLREVLAVAEFRGTLPLEMVAVGLEPATFALGDPMTPAVADNVDLVVEMAVKQLRAWGHRCAPRAVVGGAAAEARPSCTR
ncbi:MAG: HyaD/HybD family hydrogenase maturation endopeptidase [Gemmatimonadota bacterium]|nr:HyaD/HybD family hydrogenase maturation endopeptidase [Gemmatimonadota bacterium]